MMFGDSGPWIFERPDMGQALREHVILQSLLEMEDPLTPVRSVFTILAPSPPVIPKAITVLLIKLNNVLTRTAKHRRTKGRIYKQYSRLVIALVKLDPEITTHLREWAQYYG